MDFSTFDTGKIDEYAAQAKVAWGATPEYREFEQKRKGRTKERDQAIAAGLMAIFRDFGAIRETDPAAAPAQALAKRLQDYITEHYYHCSNQVLSGLGRMYAAGGDFTKNIDSYGGEGTAAFANEAIQIYCGP